MSLTVYQVESHGLCLRIKDGVFHGTVDLALGLNYIGIDLMVIVAYSIRLFFTD